MPEDSVTLEFRGRLNVDDLAFFQRVQAAIRIRPVFRILFVLLLLCGLIPLIGNLLRPDSPFRDLSTALLGIMVSYIVADQLGLRFVRYRISAHINARKAEETVLRCDPKGVTWFPAHTERKYVSFGWTHMRLMSLPEGLIFAVSGTAFVLLPVRDVTAEQREQLVAMARSAGAAVDVTS